MVAGAVFAAASVGAQTPQPFPGAGRPAAQAPRTPASPPPAPVQGQTAAPASPAASAAASTAPTAASLGFPIYPNAQFLASYDAGRGQRYYLFGTTTPYLDIVQYYKTQLREGGDVVFKEPPTHMFSTGRFREETMAFPPGVTVKDWTWGGSQGYPNTRLGGQPARFPTVIMFVPLPAAAPGAR
jgi:hypothetical protein